MLLCTDNVTVPLVKRILPVFGMMRDLYSAYGRHVSDSIFMINSILT